MNFLGKKWEKNEKMNFFQKNEKNEKKKTSWQADIQFF